MGYLLEQIRATTAKLCPREQTFEGMWVSKPTECTVSTGQRKQKGRWTESPGPEEATVELCKALGQRTLQPRKSQVKRPGGVPEECCWENSRAVETRRAPRVGRVSL